MDEHATFSFGFFEGGPTTTAAAPPPPSQAAAPATSAIDRPQKIEGRRAPPPPQLAEARELTFPEDGGAQPALPPLSLSPIEVAPGVTLLKGTVAGEAAAAALLRGRDPDGKKGAAGGGAAAAAEERVGGGGGAGGAGQERRQLLAESDLVKGAYEGGFKLWEGALDLCAYLVLEQQQHGGGESGGQQPPPSSPLERLAAAAAAAAAASPAGRGRRPRVLELGCGHGLPGVMCLLAGADVDFQDYNAEVLEQLTRPNVEANVASAEAVAAVRRAAAATGTAAAGGAGGTQSGGGGDGDGAPPPPPGRARYFAGDWQGLPDLLRRLDEREGQQSDEEEEEEGPAAAGGARRAPPAAAAAARRRRHHPHYDLVLTAETLYDAERGQAALLHALEATVGPPPSAALVASKTHYFGVGGGTRQFRALLLERARVRERAGRPGAEGVAAAAPALAVVEARSTVLQDGASNRREVLWLERRR